jgi:uncharacterized protein (TIGR03083 family)
MATVKIAELIDALQLEGERLAAAADAAGPDARVPTCPEWVVRDLVRHVGGVHRWATGIVSGPRTDVWKVGLEELVGGWPSDPDLTGWFRQGHAALIGALSTASPDLACWSFLAAPSPLAFWARRQGHETAMHRVDAELASGGPSTGFSAEFAADGIDELVTCFITRPGGRLKADPPRSLRVQSLDTADSWLLHIGPDGVQTSRTDGEADCQLSGPASSLYQALWNRQPVDARSVTGDSGVLGLFLDRVHFRWA